MAFVKKTWTDRIAEFINRRTLTKSDGTTEIVTVARNEGTISQEGDAFNAANMNDLEQRIADEFTELNNNLADTNSNMVKCVKSLSSNVQMEFMRVETSGANRTITLQENYDSLLYFDYVVTGAYSQIKPRDVTLVAPNKVSFKIVSYDASVTSGSLTFSYIFIGTKATK